MNKYNSDRKPKIMETTNTPVSDVKPPLANDPGYIEYKKQIKQIIDVLKIDPVKLGDSVKFISGEKK